MYFWISHLKKSSSISNDEQTNKKFLLNIRIMRNWSLWVICYVDCDGNWFISENFFTERMKFDESKNWWIFCVLLSNKSREIFFSTIHWMLIIYFLTKMIWYLFTFCSRNRYRSSKWCDNVKSVIWMESIFLCNYHLILLCWEQ